jgi:hypothetical protein
MLRHALITAEQLYILGGLIVVQYMGLSAIYIDMLRYLAKLFIKIVTLLRISM